MATVFARLGTKESLPIKAEGVEDEEILLTISDTVDPETVRSWLRAYGIEAFYESGVRVEGEKIIPGPGYFRIGENSHMDRPRLIVSLLSVGKEAVAEALSGTRETGEVRNLFTSEVVIV